MQHFRKNVIRNVSFVLKTISTGRLLVEKITTHEGTDVSISFTLVCKLGLHEFTSKLRKTTAKRRGTNTLGKSPGMTVFAFSKIHN